MLAKVEDGDVGTLAGVKRGDRPADAAVGAGDDRDLVVQGFEPLRSAAPNPPGSSLASDPGSASSWIIGSVLVSVTALSSASALGELVRRPHGGCCGAGQREQGREVELAAGLQGARGRRLAGIAAFVAGRHGRHRRAGGGAVGATQNGDYIKSGTLDQLPVGTWADNGG